MIKEHAWRYSLIMIGLMFFGALVVMRLVLLQVLPSYYQPLEKDLDNSSREWRPIFPARGRIFDRFGYLLVGNEMVYEVGCDLTKIEDIETVASEVSKVLGVNYSKTFADLSVKPTKDYFHATLAKNVSKEKKAELEKKVEEMSANIKDKKLATLNCLDFFPSLRRVYPEKSLASNLIGFVYRDGRGYFGVEEKYNTQLAGTPKYVLVPLDPNKVADLPEVPDGASLVLTIDREVQRAMEEVVDGAIKESGSKAGVIVVIDPRTGEILAIATSVRMDLNVLDEFDQRYSSEVPFNKAISQPYEPGSVYKVLTMASALDSGAVQLDTMFTDTGSIVVGGATILNWNRGAWGPQSMQGCMQHSLNVCLAWIASQEGAANFYRYMQSFGIGRLTGVDLGGEAAGRLKMPGDKDWYPADLGTNAFGQSVSATPLQMAAAVSSIANEGKMMHPHVVRSIIYRGFQQDTEIRPISQPIKAETARALTEMLAASLEKESSDALVTGYRVAGKTGTAEIPTPFGYTSSATNASFVGWGPVDDPRFLVYVWLQEPTSSPWGSIVAAPVFRKAVERLVVLINLPPDDLRHIYQGQ